MHYTPWVVSEGVPDFSTLESLAASPRFAGKSGQDLAIALWQVMVDHDLGIFHYCAPWDELWGKDSYDPLKVFNVFGFTICHIHANVLCMVARQAGLQARIANIRGHEGTEIFTDGKWHYFDADVQMFHRLRPPNENTIASREDLHKDPTLVWDQPNPSHPYIFPDRDWKGWSKLYETPPEYPDLLEDRTHSMDYRLRPGEEMTRLFHHRGRWVVFPNYPEAFRRWASETGPEGPTERYWPRRQWGNGFFVYEPNLTNASRDAECGAEEIKGVKVSPGGLVSEAKDGAAVFAFESPYVYCGVPDPWKRLPSLDGATLSATFELPAGTTASVKASIAGGPWKNVWSSKGAVGEVKCEQDFTSLADGQYNLRLRFGLEGPGATLKGFRTKLWFMVSPHSLPAMKAAGDNRMRYHAGDKFGLPTRPMLIQHRTDEENWRKSTCRTFNLTHDPQSPAKLTPFDPSEPWEAIYELKAPPGGKMAWVSAYAIIEGRKPGQPYDGHTAKIEIADSPDGPWTMVAERPIVEHPQGWHFGMFGEGRFIGRMRSGFVRFSAKVGANGFRMVGHYVDPKAAAAAAAGPLEVEHVWYEVHDDSGRRIHRHVETIPAGATAHEYLVHCDRPPHDDRITLRAASTKK